MSFNWKNALGWGCVMGWSYLISWVTGGGVPFLLLFWGSLIAIVAAILAIDKLTGDRK